MQIICELPQYMLCERPPKYRRRLFVKEAVDGLTVVRTFVPRTNRKGLKNQLLMYFGFMFSSILGSFLTSEADIVFCSSPPLPAGIAGWLIAKLKGARFVFDVRDLWPDSAIQLGALKNPLLIQLARIMENFVYRQADGIVVVTKPTAHIIRAKIGTKKPISWISNGVDTEFFAPTGQNNIQLKRSLGLEHKFVVGYIGTIGLIHGFGTIPKVAFELRQYEDIHFLVVGDGIEKEPAMADYIGLGIQNMSWLPAQPREVIRDYYSVLDVGLAPMSRSPLFKTTVPAKFYEYLALGIPVVLGVDGFARELLELSGGGVFAEPENEKDYVKKILELRANPDQISEMGRRGRQFVVQHFDRKHLAAELAKFLETDI